MASIAKRQWTLACFLIVGLFFCTNLVHGQAAVGKVGAATIGTVALAQLPTQGMETYALILQGGPFPYAKDGVVFGNRERLLPVRVRGYYREYTVRTPGSRHRGARRIACGGPVKSPEVCYYSDDHYASFRRIVP